VIERVRYEGVARCSRTFRHDGAATVMLSNLGPGIIRGDTLEIAGTVGPGAHLIVTEQSATRILGGTAPSRLDAMWTVASGATLELCPEPIIAHIGGDATISTTVECERDATLIVRDLASVAGATRLRLRLLVRFDGREAFYDSIVLAAGAPPAVGTFAMLGASPDVDRLDAFADASDLRIGVGVLPSGAFARILGPAVWPVRQALHALRDLVAEAIPAQLDLTEARASLSSR
jgi:urease accessory protein UreH